MAGVVKAMDAAMKSMNLEKISNLMDKFESQFEDLDVQSSYMENTMSQTVTTSVPQNDVDNLMQQVADEAGYVYFYLILYVLFPTFLTNSFIISQVGTEYGTADKSPKYRKLNSSLSRTRRTYSTFGKITPSRVRNLYFVTPTSKVLRVITINHLNPIFTL